MGETRTYSLDELEALSGFSKRTIAYYVGQRLVAPVGTRGRNTRYPEVFLDRLMFSRRVRELQDAGRLRAVTLDEIREVLNRLSPDELHAAAQAAVADDTLRSLFSDPDLDTSGYAFAAEDVARSLSRGSARAMRVPGFAAPAADSAAAAAPASVPPPTPTPDKPDKPERRLGGLLRMIERLARRGSKPSKTRVGDRVTQVHVTDNISLSVRNVNEDDAERVEELAELLRKLGKLP